MDSGVHTPSSSSPRKRGRENETDSQRVKREKAAERQRRKRERDRNLHNPTGISLMGFPSNDHHHQHMQQLQQQHPPQAVPVQLQQASSSSGYQTNPDNLSPDELARRERVRAAARERQRKHRMLVKQKKLRELGLDMGNEIMPNVDEVHYRFGVDGQYQQILPHEMQQPPNLHESQFPPQPQGPPGPPLGGQTFASTLLLSFSCAPLLKQHLLRTLHMSNEELASLEPVLAEAWERWDHARRAHYAEQAAKAGLTHSSLPPYPAPVVAVDPSLTPEQQQQQQQQHLAAAGYSISANGAVDSPQANEFRERFHRSIVSQPPFRGLPGISGGGVSAGDGTGSVSTPSSASSSTSTIADAIDPHLASGSAGAANGSADVSTRVQQGNANGASSAAPAPADAGTAPPITSATAGKKGKKRMLKSDV